MKALPWFVVLCGLVFGVGVLGDFDAAGRSTPSMAEPTQAPAPVEAPEEDEALELSGVTPTPAREAVAVQEQEPLQDAHAEELRALRENLAAAHAELDALHQENTQQGKRIEWLETELTLCGSEVTQGPLGRWLASLLPEERPKVETIRRVAETLREYPVEVTPAEGLWIAARYKRGDWEEWGPTVDEAVILFLGPARIAQQVPADRLAELRTEWAEEGYFGG